VERAAERTVTYRRDLLMRTLCVKVVAPWPLAVVRCRVVASFFAHQQPKLSALLQARVGSMCADHEVSSARANNA